MLQGAFMAALYSQGLAWEQMHHLVREYARQMSSVQHLLWDLTLPIMSIFNGVGFDRVVRETFKHGAQQIEDLWLRFVVVLSSPGLSQCHFLLAFLLMLFRSFSFSAAFALFRSFILSILSFFLVFPFLTVLSCNIIAGAAAHGDETSLQLKLLQAY